MLFRCLLRLRPSESSRSIILPLTPSIVANPSFVYTLPSGANVRSLVEPSCHSFSTCWFARTCSTVLGRKRLKSIQIGRFNIGFTGGRPVRKKKLAKFMCKVFSYLRLEFLSWKWCFAIWYDHCPCNLHLESFSSVTRNGYFSLWSAHPEHLEGDNSI